MHRKTRSLTLLVLALSGVLAIGGAAPARAQALDEVIEFLLSDQCANLLQSPTGRRQVTGELAAICNAPPGTGGSTGGGGASAQASALSVQNSVIQQRLEKAKAQGRGEPAPKVSRPSAARVAYADLQGSAGSDSPDPGLRSRRFDVFASGFYENLERNQTAFEDGYDSSVVGGTIGADYQFTSKFVAGIAAGYRRHDGDFDFGGDFEMTLLEPSLYVSILPTDNTYIQIVTGYGDQEFDVNRAALFTITDGGATISTVSGTLSSATDAKVYSVSAQFGYDRAVGRFTFGPRVGVNYSTTDVDPFAEAGTTGLELAVDGRSVDSVQGAVGFFGAWALGGESGVFLPQFYVEYIREFEDGASILDARFVDDSGPDALTFNYQTNVPDSGFFNVEAGFAAVLQNGIQPFVNVRAMLGNTNFDNLAGVIGVRFEL